MTLGYGPIIVVIVFLLLVGVMPAWPYSRQWGYRPTIILGIVFVLIAAFVALGGI
jgi:hypothetical protein